MKASEFFTNRNETNCGYVANQVKDMQLEELKKVEFEKCGVVIFRTNLHKYSILTRRKFKTKLVDNELWIGRII